MKKFSFTINGNKYDVEVKNFEDNVAEVEVNGSVYEVELEKSFQPPKPPAPVRPLVTPATDTDKATIRTSSPTAPKGTGTITAPLPGAILQVTVKEGDAVAIGQKLLVMEAMKMENTINSDKEGKVISVKVKPGDTVLEGDTLIEIGG